MKKLLLLVALISVCFSSFLWEFSSNAPITTKPLIYKDMLIVASDSGQVVALDPITHAQKWAVVAGKTPTDVISFSGAIVVASSDGTVSRIDQNGKVTWTTNIANAKYNASYLYGITATANGIYATTDSGLISLDASGNAKRISNESGVFSRPSAGKNFIIYGVNKKITKIGESGSVEWKADGEIWKSRALITDSYIFVGRTDGIFEEFQYGSPMPIWNYQANSMIASTPYYNKGRVFFADNSGYVYGLDESGTLKWRTKLSLGTQSELEGGFLAGKAVIFIGANDQNIYAIDQENGEILWKGAATAPVSDPVFYTGTKQIVVFGTSDGLLQAYGTEHACSIVEPIDGAMVGVKELVVSGKFISGSSGEVWVNINSGQWVKAQTTQSSWKIYIDPKKSFNPNLNTIQCKVVDIESGDDSGDRFTKVGILYNPDAPAGNMQLTLPPSILENEPFTVYVNDREDGTPLDRVKININGKDYNVDKSLNMSLAAGDYKVVSTKVGYNDVSANISVGQKGLNPLYIVVGVIIALILVYQIWEKFLKQRLARKKEA